MCRCRCRRPRRGRTSSRGEVAKHCRPNGWQIRPIGVQEHATGKSFGSYRVACWGRSRYAKFVLTVMHGSAWERRDKGNQRFWNHRCTQMHADKSHIACACVGARSMAGAEILISVYLCASVAQNTWLLSLAISAPIVFDAVPAPNR